MEGIAHPVSHWVKTSRNADEVAQDAAVAVSVANGFPGKVATLILPANTAWESASGVAAPLPAPFAAEVPAIRIDEITEILRKKEPTAIILGGPCVRAEALENASRIAQQTGATLFAQNSNARFERGAGRVGVRAIPYVVDDALKLLENFKHIIPVNAKPPVAFFAYPSKPSQLYPQDASVHYLADIDEDGAQALQQVSDALGAAKLSPQLVSLSQPKIPTQGKLTVDAINAVLTHQMPVNAIIVDEAVTSGRGTQAVTATANPHDWLQICGGSIGDGFPLATGAAIACPDRKVIALQADGSGMYTLQALWTQARESLDITTIVYANRSYAILKHELKNVEANSGTIAMDMMELDRPELDWTALARGMGVDAVKATTIAEFQRALQEGLERSGPYLIEAVI